MLSRDGWTKSAVSEWSLFNAFNEAAKRGKAKWNKKGTCLVCMLCLETLEEVKSLLLGRFCYSHGDAFVDVFGNEKDDDVSDDARIETAIDKPNVGMKCT